MVERPTLYSVARSARDTSPSAYLRRMERRAGSGSLGLLTDADRRGLTPIFHSNMTPYGEIQLRPDRRLDLSGLPATSPTATVEPGNAI
ncbi:hypothetical protein ABT294_25940 [Nonomuraea sp. NPDC000554]|uniref:hypothetical protein n=1 Tax=Nonomuraea sp. NPDC000554 TaxID=3154259 RepID=UPI00331EA137